jgi:hypothetical protein
VFFYHDFIVFFLFIPFYKGSPPKPPHFSATAIF